MIEKHRNRNDSDLLVLKEDDSSFIHFCKELAVDATGFEFKMVRVATLVEKGGVFYDVLKPFARPMSLPAARKLAIFKSGGMAKAMFPSTESEEYPFAGIRFFPADPTALKKTLKLALEKGISIKNIFYQSSDLFDYCIELEAGVIQESESSSVSLLKEECNIIFGM